jgi:hypothetical protein
LSSSIRRSFSGVVAMTGRSWKRELYVTQVMISRALRMIWTVVGVGCFIVMGVVR